MSDSDVYLDCAVAETTIGLYKTELVAPGRPWRTADQLELATLEWIDWFNHRRLHSSCGYRPARRVRAALAHHLPAGRLDPSRITPVSGPGG